MTMNRRNVLIGLGTIVAGGGAALGTGAFSSVQADRTVEVDVAGDANALLGLDADDETDLVNNDGSADRLVIDLSDGNLDSAQGVNTEATTTIEPGFTVENNGTQYVDIEIDDVGDSDITVSFEADVESNVGDSGVDLNDNVVRVEDGESFDVNIIVDTTGVDNTGDSIDDNATIVATESEEEGDTDLGDDDGLVESD